MSEESFASAAERFSMRTPLGIFSSDDNFAAKNPFTKTKRLPGNFVNAASLNNLLSAPLTEISFAGVKVNFSIGATLVKRQSSSRNVGNPNSENCAMPALRKGASHFGCDADSAQLNCFTIGSTAVFE